jgi:hypothetical protein
MNIERQIQGSFDCHCPLGSVLMVFTIYGFSSLIYSSPTEPFSAQARLKQSLDLTAVVVSMVQWISYAHWGNTHFSSQYMCGNHNTRIAICCLPHVHCLVLRHCVLCCTLTCSKLVLIICVHSVLLFLKSCMLSH